MNNLFKRSLTGIIYVAVIMAGTLIHPISFALVFLILMLFTLLEFYNLIEKAGHSPQKKVGLVLGGILFLICHAYASGIIPIEFCLLFFPFLIVIFFLEVLRKKKETLQNSMLTLGGFIYIAVPFSLLNFMVNTGENNGIKFYPWILAGIFFIIWMYDSMAYVGGSLLGKHKMCENISPKKSWEGLITGAVFAVIMGILNAVFFPSLTMLNWIVISVIVVFFGTMGDLFESKLKRDLNIKDSGSILPGHGGFLDRFDSFLFIIPVVFIWLILGGTI